jgi:hypothetical protein
MAKYCGTAEGRAEYSHCAGRAGAREVEEIAYYLRCVEQVQGRWIGKPRQREWWKVVLPMLCDVSLCLSCSVLDRELPIPSPSSGSSAVQIIPVLQSRAEQQSRISHFWMDKVGRLAGTVAPLSPLYQVRSSTRRPSNLPPPPAIKTTIKTLSVNTRCNPSAQLLHAASSRMLWQIQQRESAGCFLS